MGTVSSKIRLQKLVASERLNIAAGSSAATIKGAIAALLMNEYPFLELGPLSEFTVKVKDDYVDIKVPVDDNDSRFDSGKLKETLGV